jgi:hypothetical protein
MTSKDISNILFVRFEEFVCPWAIGRHEILENHPF